MVTILSITGSDGTGGAGIQADVQTITAMGGRALSAVTCLSVLHPELGLALHDVPTELVIGQVQALTSAFHPTVVKVGLVRDAATIRALRNELAGCRQLVCDPGLLSVRGTHLVEADAVAAFRRYLLPEATLAIMRCDEVEMMLNVRIQSDEDMLHAAQRLTEIGAKWVLLRGGRLSNDRLTALLYGEGNGRFFSSLNTEGWLQHGVGGAMSSAIATRLAMGDDVPTAVRRAHDYMHNQVIYSSANAGDRLRPADLYDQFLDLVSQHYATAHNVQFYADQLNISTRYLSKITANVSAQTPKQIVDDYLLHEAKVLLNSTRLTVQEISIKLGFQNQAHFSRFFRVIEGQTPSEYRK